MNPYQVKVLMREAQSIVDNFKSEDVRTTEERRLAAKSEQIQFLSAEIELLDRLISMLEAGVDALDEEDGDG